MNQQMTHVQYRVIDASSDGQRIDNYLFKHFKKVPKSHLYRRLRRGEIRVNKCRIKADYRLRIDDSLRLPPMRVDQQDDSECIPPKSLIDCLKENLLYEDESILLLNKPVGLAVHGGDGIRVGLIECLRFMFKETTFLEMAHRLDKDTSGLMLFAKSRHSLVHLHQQFREGSIEKRYYAWLNGQVTPEKWVVKQPLRKNQLLSGERMVVVAEDGKGSETHFEKKQCTARATLVCAKPLTGRTHQIRVHAAHFGHSIVGDPKYQARGEKPIASSRLLLHAYSLTFIHPLTEEPMTYRCEPDQAFDISYFE